MNTRRRGALLRQPLFWILFASALARLPGLFWGMPNSDGWDDDGVAPRNFLVGLAQSYAGGGYFTYPPLHMILLAILGAPALVAALWHARSLAPHDVIAAFIQVPYMTFFAVTARLVSAAMSVATIAIIGKMTQLVMGRTAGILAAATCALDSTLLYYGQVTNLDGPYLFWCAVSLWQWTRVIAERELRALRWATLAAAAAVATKDQAYAIFLFSIPGALGLWFLLDPWPRRQIGAVLRPLAGWTLVALAALLLVDGTVTNPIGFAKRLAFLAGPASRDYVAYHADLSGRIYLLLDLLTTLTRAYPAPTILLAAIGVGVFLRSARAEPGRLVAGLLPALAIGSFTIAFNLVALRTENRFGLPQSMLMSVYVGALLAWAAAAARSILRSGVAVTALVTGGLASWRCLGIDAAFIHDPRYDAERWLRVHVQPGDTIEAYGLNVYLPRFPAAAMVSRIDRKPLARRNPLPNVREIDGRFDAVVSRNPRFLVMSASWVKDYLDAGETKAASSGRLVPPVQQEIGRDMASRRYFQALFADRLPYRLVHRSDYAAGPWPTPRGFESLAQTVYVFERDAPP